MLQVFHRIIEMRMRYLGAYIKDSYLNVITG
jgi:hypothetical protein